MKKNWIYIFKQRNSERISEGLYRATINGVHFFETLPFSSTETCPRHVVCTNIDWLVPVCHESKCGMDVEYRNELSAISQ